MNAANPKPNRPTFRVWMNNADDPDELTYAGEVQVTHGDQLRAELEAATRGLPNMKDAPMLATTVWVWAAMVRLGLYDGKFMQFKNVDLAEMESVKDDGEPDPTGAGFSSDSD